MSCDVGCRRGLDTALLWLWRRPAAITPIQSLAWELLYAAGGALKSKKKKEREREVFRLISMHFSVIGVNSVYYQ